MDIATFDILLESSWDKKMKLDPRFLVVLLVSLPTFASAEDARCHLEQEGLTWSASCLFFEGSDGPWKGRCYTATTGDVAPEKGTEKVVHCRVKNKGCDSITDLMILLSGSNRQLSIYNSVTPNCDPFRESKLSAIDVVNIVHDKRLEIKLRDKVVGTSAEEDDYVFLRWKGQRLKSVLTLPISLDPVRLDVPSVSSHVRVPGEDADYFIVTTRETDNICNIRDVEIFGECTEEDRSRRRRESINKKRASSSGRKHCQFVSIRQ